MGRGDLENFDGTTLQFQFQDTEQEILNLSHAAINIANGAIEEINAALEKKDADAARAAIGALVKARQDYTASALALLGKSPPLSNLDPLLDNDARILAVRREMELAEDRARSRLASLLSRGSYAGGGVSLIKVSLAEIFGGRQESGIGSGIGGAILAGIVFVVVVALVLK